MLRGSAVLALVGLTLAWFAPSATALPGDNPDGNDYVALAYSFGDQQLMFGQAGTSVDADTIALNLCQTQRSGPCQVVARNHHGCAAVVFDEVSGAFADGKGATVDEAIADAQNRIPVPETGGGGWCSDPPGN